VDSPNAASGLHRAPAQIIETLKKIEAAGFAEVILSINVCLKPVVSEKSIDTSNGPLHA